MQIDHQLIEINLPDLTVEGDLSLPEDAIGFVIFSHGSGNSMFNPKNKSIAERFKKEKLGFLLFDLLTDEEDRNLQNRFELETLTQRLIEVTLWVERKHFARDLGIGYFGAGTGAATALKAAARLPGKIKTVVTRGGRADMAFDDLFGVEIPVLMIMGSKDEKTIRLNEKASEMLSDSKIVIVDGATNTFEETGALEELCTVSTDWFKTKLPPQTVI